MSRSSAKAKAESRRQLVFDLERHSFEALPLTQLYQVLIKRKPSWWTAFDKADDKKDGSRSDQFNDTASVEEEGKKLVSIPDTVVWENNIPKGWFYYDTKDCCVMRRKVETQQIQQSFLRGAMYENDVVAVTYSMPLSGEKDELQYRFLTASQFPSFLFENRRGKGTSILQKFVFPLTITHNDMIQAVWTPTVVQVNRRQNVNPILDERVEVNERCATFEGRTHHSQIMHTTSRLRSQIEEVCNNLAVHFKETDPKFAISRMLLYFKMTDTSQLQLLFCSSARVLSTSVHHTDSFLHRKFRVSLELATRFTLRETEEELLRELEAIKKQRAIEAGEATHQIDEDSEGDSIQRTKSGKRASLMLSLGTPSKRDQTLKMLTEHHEAELALQEQKERKQSVDTHARKAGTPEPTVGSMKASRLGFVLRDSNSIFGSSGGKARPSSSMATTNSRMSRASTASRASIIAVDRKRRSGSGQQTVATVIQDAMRAERQEDLGDEIKQKHRRMLEKCVEKVGQPAARTAYLGIKNTQAAGLEDPERMELLCLRLREHRIRSDVNGLLSGDGAKEKTIRVSEPPSLLDDSDGSHVVPTCTSPEQRNRRLSEGLSRRHLLHDMAPETEALQQHLLDIVYEAQSHFSCMMNMPFSISVDPSHPAEQLLLEELNRLDAAKHRSGVVVERAVGDNPALLSSPSTPQGSNSFHIEEDHGIAYGVIQPGATLQFSINRSQPMPDTWVISVTIPPQKRAAQLLQHIVHEALRNPAAQRAAALLCEFQESGGANQSSMQGSTKRQSAASEPEQEFYIKPDAEMIPPEAEKMQAESAALAKDDKLAEVKQSDDLEDEKNEAPSDPEDPPVGRDDVAHAQRESDEVPKATESDGTGAEPTYTSLSPVVPPQHKREPSNNSQYSDDFED